MKPEPRHWPAVEVDIWGRIRSEFGLSTQDEFETHYETLYNNPAPFRKRAVRVFVGDETGLPVGLRRVGVFPLLARVWVLGLLLRVRLAVARRRVRLRRAVGRLVAGVGP